MKKCHYLLLLFLLVGCIFPVQGKKQSNNNGRTRLIVTSDIGGSDPDDQQSMVHLMTLLDRIDLEGIIYQHAWVSFNKGNEVTVTEKILDAYERVWPNLQVHSQGFPKANTLRERLVHGQKEAAMAGVGEGKDSPGSELIIRAVDNDDPRPVWIAAWSGVNTLAQALWKVQHTRSADEVEKFVSKLRVYDVLGQDDAGAWMVTQFPNLIYIRNKQVYGWAPDDKWVKQHVQAVGELGKEYPQRKWATEGDSPSFLYVVDNGLNVPEHPDWGGWGGRFDREKKANIRSMDWVPRSGLDETKYDPYLMLGSSAEGSVAIRLWQQEIFNDFEARMQWSTTNDFHSANHHPIATIGRDLSTDVVYKTIQAGKKLELDASRSTDPDGDKLTYQWSFYPEPSNYQGKLEFMGNQSKLSLSIPTDAKGYTMHLILRVTDNGTPALTSYRRVVVTIK